MRETFSGSPTFPLHIILNEKEYRDNVDITPEEIYQEYYDHKVLPKTAAVNVQEYIDHFRPWVEDGYEIIHINLGHALSSVYQNCCLAAEELRKRTRNCHASFILDTLTFLHAGGRCSSVAALGANVLKLKPCIQVDNSDGSMGVGKKYRGTLDKVLVKYVKDELSRYTDINTDLLFITHSGIPQEYIDLVKKTVEETMDFKEIHVTTASCTISAHCGPNTLGILFETK